jgi:hypothetical protein
MSTRAFQLALCELAASPELCLEVRSRPRELGARFGLSEAESRRLEAVVRQAGMSMNCTLHRSNRITPIYTLLHNTCFILGGALGRVMDDYWRETRFLDLQYGPEIERFARFLRNRLRAAQSDNPYVEEVLDFDLAVAGLRYAPRRGILRELQSAGSDGSRPPRLHPLMRVVSFRHEPTVLLRMLAEQRYPESPLPEGTYFLILSMVDDPLSVTRLPVDIGRVLWLLQRNAADLPPPGTIRGLVDAGYLIG